MFILSTEIILSLLAPLLVLYSNDVCITGSSYLIGITSIQMILYVLPVDRQILVLYSNDRQLLVLYSNDIKCNSPLQLSEIKSFNNSKYLN